MMEYQPLSDFTELQNKWQALWFKMKIELSWKFLRGTSFSDDLKVYKLAEVIHCAVIAHITNNFTLEWKLGTRLLRFDENDNK